MGGGLQRTSMLHMCPKISLFITSGFRYALILKNKHSREENGLYEIPP